VEEIRCDVRDVTAEMLGGFDAVIHLAGLSNDPLGDYNPSLTEAINDKASVRLAGSGEGGGRRALSVCVLLQHLRSRGRGLPRRDRAFNPVTPYGVSKVNVERGVPQLADERFSPIFLRASTCLWPVAANPLRPRAEQPHRLGVHHGRGLYQERWHALAADRTCRGHVARLHCRSGGAARPGSCQAFNVGTTTENYQVRDIAETGATGRAGSRSAMRRVPGLIRAAIASTATTSRGRCMISSRNGPRGAGSRSCMTLSAAKGLARGFRGPEVQAHRPC
jgi:nucleoside-diphosphate-sugar epimerase